MSSWWKVVLWLGTKGPYSVHPPTDTEKEDHCSLYDCTSKRWYLSPCERYSRNSNWEKAYPLLQVKFCVFQWEETIASSKANLSFWEKGRMRWSGPAIFSINLSLEMMIVLAASSCKTDCQTQSSERAKHGIKELGSPLKIKR